MWFSLKLEPFKEVFFYSGHSTCEYTVGGLRRRGANISVDLFLFALIYITNCMTKLKFNNFFKNLKQKIIL